MINTKDTTGWDGDHRLWAILTSFNDEVDENGTVWKIEAFEIDREKYLYALISFLSRPVNTCFDKMHSYLYVCNLDMPPDDPDGDVTGQIFRYAIKWDEDDDFELEDYIQTTVWDGSGPTDCAVDSVGNLIFSTKDNHIYAISYSDIGTNEGHFTLAGPDWVDDCQALDIREDGTMMWVNNGGSTEENSGLRMAKWEEEDIK